MNVLSLFDGISCGQIALNKAGINYDNYFASEIDKYAIKVTQTNYPNTTQLGDVLNVKGSDLPKIDLLIAGSPCQGFSRSGKQLNFEDPRSKLFFEFVRLKDKLKPKYFLLENVKMKKEYEDTISEYLGVKPIVINSSLVSAQNRVRYYWTNIVVEELKDKNILLKDIVDKNASGLDFFKDSIVFVPTSHSSKSGLVCLGGVIKPSHKFWSDKVEELPKKFSQGNRVYSENGKSVSISASTGGIGGKTGLYKIGEVIRKLTRLECERLQNVPENYTNSISEAQAIKALGNGWTVDVICHIFRNIK